MKEGERSLEVFQLLGKIVIEGKDQFDADVNGMSKTADKLGNGLKKVASIAVSAAAAAGAAMVAVGKQSLDAYAEHEQLFGGIEALFGNNASAQDKVVTTAKKAWQDLTMSQSDYYKSFMSSYPLIKASIEDQNTAIETTNRLLTLEADLANTFGGDVSNYANAINWALKGTYSYLDNLNIGISGTAEGFLEAANNSGLFDKKLKSLDELTSDQKLAVIEHYAAQYGVLGRTADEAAGTIQGSTLMMKAAWQNLLIGFADETQDVSVLVGELLSSCVTVAENVVPRIVQIFHGILDAVYGLFGQVWDYIALELLNTGISFENMTAKAQAEFGKLWQEMKKVWDSLGKPIWDIISSSIETVKNAFADKMPAIKEFVSKCFSDIGSFWENNLKPCFEAIGDFIESVVAPIFDAVFSAGIVSAVQNGFEGIKNLWNNTLMPVFTGITDFITGVFSGDFDQAMNGLSSIATGVLDGIATAFNTTMETAKDFVNDAISNIQEAFDFSWSLPSLKLPHISISGSFSLNPPSVPSFGISWYKKAYENAMVLSDPTIFGYSSKSGKMLGGGEGNGNEVVAGEAHLMNMIQEAVAAQNETLVYYLDALIDMLADYFPQVIEAAGHNIVTNDGVILARYAPKFNVALGKISKGKDRGR